MLLTYYFNKGSICFIIYLKNPFLYLQLIWAVERLSQPIAILQIMLHFVGINLGVGQLSQCAHLPHENPEGPDVATLVVVRFLQGLQREPLDGSVLPVAQRIVVAREEVSTQGAVCELHAQLIINTVEERN